MSAQSGDPWKSINRIKVIHYVHSSCGIVLSLSSATCPRVSGLEESCTRIFLSSTPWFKACLLVEMHSTRV